MCKNVTISASAKDIKNFPQHERIYTIYEAMTTIGKQIKQLMGKGATQINQ